MTKRRIPTKNKSHPTPIFNGDVLLFEPKKFDNVEIKAPRLTSNNPIFFIRLRLFPAFIYHVPQNFQE